MIVNCASYDGSKFNYTCVCSLTIIWNMQNMQK